MKMKRYIPAGPITCGRAPGCSAYRRGAIPEQCSICIAFSSHEIAELNHWETHIMQCISTALMMLLVQSCDANHRAHKCLYILKSSIQNNEHKALTYIMFNTNCLQQLSTSRRPASEALPGCQGVMPLEHGPLTGRRLPLF